MVSFYFYYFLIKANDLSTFNRYYQSSHFKSIFWTRNIIYISSMFVVSILLLKKIELQIKETYTNYTVAIKLESYQLPMFSVSPPSHIACQNLIWLKQKRKKYCIRIHWKAVVTNPRWSNTYLIILCQALNAKQTAALSQCRLSLKCCSTMRNSIIKKRHIKRDQMKETRQQKKYFHIRGIMLAWLNK